MTHPLRRLAETVASILAGHWPVGHQANSCWLHAFIIIDGVIDEGPLTLFIYFMCNLKMPLHPPVSGG